MYALVTNGHDSWLEIRTYYGYNKQDAVVISKAAVDRGLGRSMFYKTYSDEERRYPGGQKDVFKMPPATTDGYLGEHAYAKLSEDGIIEPEMEVEEGDVLVGKVAPKSKTELSPEEKLLHAIFGRAGEDVKNDSLEVPAGTEGVVAEQFGHDAGDAFERIGNRARLFEYFLLHVMPVGAEFGCAGVRVHGAHFALRGVAGAVDDPAALRLQVDHVAFLQVDDLIGGAG